MTPQQTHQQPKRRWWRQKIGRAAARDALGLQCDGWDLAWCLFEQVIRSATLAHRKTLSIRELSEYSRAKWLNSPHLLVAPNNELVESFGTDSDHGKRRRLLASQCSTHICRGQNASGLINFHSASDPRSTRVYKVIQSFLLKTQPTLT